MAFEIIYDEDEDGEIFWLFRNEAETMKRAGITVRTRPSGAATSLLWRGCIVDEDGYPSDHRHLHDPATYGNYSCIARWYPVIEELTIPTLFVDNLDKGAVDAIRQRGWKRVFVKDAVKSLVEEDPLESVWPDVSFEVMRKKFSENPRKGAFALRDYRKPEDFERERRYWIMRGNIHHSSGEVPGIVREAAKRLDKLGGFIYTIDATPDLVVEVNAGETSDRKTDNTAEDFAAWIKKAFDA